MKQKKVSFLRYPGGKQRLLGHILLHLPSPDSIDGRFVEPFLGGGAVFFAVNPRRALLSDINTELIDLYRGIRRYPFQVWKYFSSFPSTKKAYYQIRNRDCTGSTLAQRAARTLYLNRTCFKGMWRQNAQGQFNVGYGGQDRRWVVDGEVLLIVSKRLKRAVLRASDFECIIDACTKEDFIFIDPPYGPGESEMQNDHYIHSGFCLEDHKRLAKALKKASARGVKWAMTTSSSSKIVRLFRNNRIIPFPRGTGNKPGILTNHSGEVLICNYKENSK